MKEIKQNRLGVAWNDFQKEVAYGLKNYLLIKVSKSQSRTVKSMWRRGCTASDAISYVILSAK